MNVYGILDLVLDSVIKAVFLPCFGGLSDTGTTAPVIKIN